MGLLLLLGKLKIRIQYQVAWELDVGASFCMTFGEPEHSFQYRQDRLSGNYYDRRQ